MLTGLPVSTPRAVAAGKLRRGRSHHPAAPAGRCVVGGTVTSGPGLQLREPGSAQQSLFTADNLPDDSDVMAQLEGFTFDGARRAGCFGCSADDCGVPVAVHFLSGGVVPAFALPLVVAALTEAAAAGPARRPVEMLGA
jgi:hypothetical protein